MAGRLHWRLFLQAAQLKVEVDGAFTSGVRPPGRITFTTSNSAGTLAEKMRIDSTGNVGIGTTAPTALLHLLTTGPTEARQTIESTGVTGLSTLHLRAGTDDVQVSLDRAGNLFSITNLATDPINYLFNATTTGTAGNQLYLSTSGNVGIGTTTPTSFKLEVAGNIGPEADNTRDLGSASRRWANIYGTNFVGAITPTGFTQGSVAFAGSGGTLTQDNPNFFWDNTNDRLGIGTTTPGSPLSIAKTGISSLTALNLANNQGGSGDTISIAMSNGGGTGGLIGYERQAAASGDFTFYTSATFGGALAERMRITAAGNVGIGTTSPATALHVVNNVRIERFGSTPTLQFKRANGIISSPTALILGNTIASFTAQGYGDTGYGANVTGSLIFKAAENFTDSAQGTYFYLETTPSGSTTPLERFRITDSGNVGIGTTTPTSFKLEIAGNVGPEADNTRDLGSASRRWANIYGTNFVGAITPSGFTQGSVAFAGSGGTLTQDNANFFFDDTNNRLGIGTTGPTRDLTFGATNSGISLDTVDGTDNKRLQIMGGGDSTYLRGAYINLFGNEYAGSGGNMNLVTGQTGFFSVLTGTGPLERMRIQTDGNVGIGTTAPNSLLSVGATNNFQVDSSGRVGVFGAPTTSAGITIAGTHPGNATTLQGASFDPTFPATTTSSANILDIRGVTAAASFTVGNWRGINITSPVIGAGSAITTATGISVGAITTGTNNAGVVIGEATGTNQSNLVIGQTTIPTGTYSIYNASTDQNYFAGNVGIGTTAPDDLLHLSKSAVSGVSTLQFSAGNTTTVGNFSSGRIASGHTTTNYLGAYLDLQYPTAEDTFTTGLRLINGNVGIGTTAPSVKLQVVDAAAFPQIMVSDSIADSVNKNGWIGVPHYLNSEEAFGFISGRVTSTTNVVRIGGSSSALNAATDIQFYTAANNTTTTGNLVMLINSAGNVGIGTTTPGDILHIKKDQGVSTAATIENANAGAGVVAEFIARNGTGISDGLRMGATGTGYTTSGVFLQDGAYIDAETALSGGLGIATRANAPIMFATNGQTNERMRIAADGNVGIGTTSPLALFSVGSTSQFQVSSAGLVTYVDGTTNTATHVCKNSSGQLAPCNTTGTGAAFVQGGNSFGALATLGTNDAFGLAFETSGTEKVRIDTNGNVGIGTAGPLAKLDVQGAPYGGGIWSSTLRLFDTTSATTGTGAGIDLAGYTNGTSSTVDFGAGIKAAKSNSTADNYSFDLAFWTRTNGSVPAEAMRILHNGNVGIGTTAPGYKLEVNGTGFYNGKLAINNASLGSNSLDVFTAAAGTIAAFQSNGTLSNGTQLMSVTHSNAATGTVEGFRASLNSTVNGNISVYQSGAGTANFNALALSTGDAQSTYGLNGGQSWAVGLDNSDSDSFKIAGSTALGTSDYLTILTGGNVGIGTTSPLAGSKLDVNGDVNLSGSNRSLFFRRADGTTLSGTITTDGASQFGINANNSSLNLLSRDGVAITQTAAVTGSPRALILTGASHTSLTASVEAPDVLLNLARVVQFSTGALATQRAVRVDAPAYAFVGASTITDATTLAISGAPISSTNATISNSSALRISAGAVGSGTTNAYGLYVDAPTGATNNYAATFATGNVGIGTTAPAAKLGFAASTASTDGIDFGNDIKLYRGPAERFISQQEVRLILLEALRP